jgi:hypothetical protein
MLTYPRYLKLAAAAAAAAAAVVIVLPFAAF